MPQQTAWDREYRKSKLLTKENKPQADVVRFVKFLYVHQNSTAVEFWSIDEINKIDRKKILDLGSGTGRNSYYFAELGAKVIGFEISQTAINIAKTNMSMGILDII